MANPKKRERNWTDVLSTGTPVKKQKAPFIAPDFADPIDQIKTGAMESVYRKIQLPIRFGKPHIPKEYALVLSSTFSTKTHTKDDGQQWTQGWLDLGGSTTYDDILPDKISRKRASVESQILKKLALGESYKPRHKVSFINETNNQQTLHKSVSGWGRPALQSYLEEITGRLSLGVDDVGSGIRAMIYASSLRLKNSGKAEEDKFKQRLLKNYLQLLPAMTPPVGGASHLNTLIHQESLVPGSLYPTATQNSVQSEIKRSHKEINSVVRYRFKKKWDDLRKGNTQTRAGSWWGAKLGDNLSGERNLNISLSTQQVKKKALMEEYLSYKLARHGITHYK